LLKVVERGPPAESVDLHRCNSLEPVYGSDSGNLVG
jgi:hypothetical protein